MGLLYIKTLGIYLHINTYFMILDNSKIEIKYTSNQKIKKDDTYSLPIKIVNYDIKLFNDDLLKIPIKLQPIINFKNLQITVLSEELLNKYESNKHPFDIHNFDNRYSQDKYIVILNINEINTKLINKLEDKLYILTKFSGKEIHSYQNFTDMLSKIKSKTTRKLVITNNHLPEEQVIYI